jgi:hypothetical protein
MTLRAGLAKLVGASLAGSLLVFAAPAAATPCHQHTGHGNSEIAQYLENVPGACGDQGIGGGNGSGDQGTSAGSGQGGSGVSGTGLPTGTINRLESLGPAGAQAASFAESTSPGTVEGTGAGGSGGSSAAGIQSASGGTASVDDGGDGSFLSALADLVTGNEAGGSSDQGMGTLLPILLGGVLLGGVGILALRRGRPE